MPHYYNILGRITVNGTNLLDRFFAFTSDDNFDHALPDALIASFSWTTSLRRADGSFLAFNGNNVQVSEDIYVTNGGADVLYGSNLSDAIFYNNGVFANGVGSIGNVQQFDLAGGDDFVDFSAHGAGGVDYSKQVTVRGGIGNDTIVAGSNNDILFGDAGNDIVIGNAGGDTLDGGDGDDILYGDDLGAYAIAGQDVLRGGAGNDTLWGGARGDLLEGGADNDVLHGELSGDTLSGGGGDDTLYGDEVGAAAGGDKLFGDAGNDQLFGGAGNDVIEGGADSDTSVYTGNRSDYTIALNPNGSIQITDLRFGSPDGSDTVKTVEFFQFADVTIAAAMLNNPPVITSDGGGDTGPASVAENTTYVTTVTASDTDAGQTLSYSIGGGPDSSFFMIDAVTGALHFIAAPDFENAVDADGDGIYSVQVRVSDGTGGTDTQLISVSVGNVNDGLPPLITSNGGNQTAIVNIDEGSTTVTAVLATDADGPSITYRIAGGVDAALFSIDAITGELSFRQSPDFENPTDTDADGDYQVIVEASDGLNADRQAISVLVGNLNDNPVAITSNGGGPSAALTIDENGILVTVVTAEDDDGTAPSYSIVGGADAALFNIDAATGALTFVSSPDFEQPADADRDNVYDVIVQASDGAFFDQQALAITVANTNDNAPVIISNGGGGAAAINVVENSLAVTSIAATDPDGPVVLTYRIAGGADAALFQIDANGVLGFRTAPDFEDPLDTDRNNIYDVTIEASDGVSTDIQALTITVTDINEVGRTITGTSANDIISPMAGNLALRSTALNDTILGLDGNDTIDGGGGTDRMEGGAGNDTYTVDRFVDDGRDSNDDLVVELAAGGIDRVNALVDYRLAAEVENLTLLGTAVVGIGNGLANQLIGNAVANQLSGLDGNDTILGNAGDDYIDGGAGDDTLVGGEGADNIVGGDGADRLDGGIGADRLEGGAGSDVYIIDTFSNDGNSANDDVAIEAAGGGTDAANASVSYVLGAEIENLTLTGSSAIDGTGNVLANTVTGNAATNVLSGLEGNDTLNGAGGNDTLDGGNGSDTLDGGAGDDQLFGGAASDTLKGSAGTDLLVGGAGKDTLTGGADADTFLFFWADTTLNTNLDRITDFASGTDKIDLDILAGAYNETAIGTNVYSDALAAANSVRTAGISSVFVAGPSGGWLFWDGNGDGLFDQSIVLTGASSLGAFDATDII